MKSVEIGAVRRANNAGVEIADQVTGEGRPVVLLHGFPDTGRSWRHQVEALVDAGFKVIVPDMRGYGASDKPIEPADYDILLAVADVSAVLEDAGVERAHVVGHDWGAAAAWVFAAIAPERVDHLVAMAPCHPATFRAGGFEQHQKSWYMLLFHFDRIAERWSYLEPPPALPLVQAPTMGIWSSGDFALTEGQMTRSAAEVSGSWRYERLEGPGHWMHLEAPAEVNRLLLDFLPT